MAVESIPEGPGGGSPTVESIPLTAVGSAVPEVIDEIGTPTSPTVGSVPREVVGSAVPEVIDEIGTPEVPTVASIPTPASNSPTVASIPVAAASAPTVESIVEINASAPVAIDPVAVTDYATQAHTVPIEDGVHTRVEFKTVLSSTPVIVFPESPSVGQHILCVDNLGQWGNYPLTVNPNGYPIDQTAGQQAFPNANAAFLFYFDGTRWKITT